ncbi:MAG: exodeoxyribonuclease VII large subunit, partial [Bryobacterales bacterium]|nr:exodeoxyribonuclease VII large subunit [Bryobacterales bacterium]
RIYPTLVQGEGSVEAVCRAIEYFSNSAWPHVVIVARGGGSLEDLWTFNEEAVARAITACRMPVISAVGHETDFTIADFAADLRAATPSAAAELVICPREQVFDQLAVFDHKLLQATRYRLAMAARALHERGVDRASSILHRNVGRLQQRVDDLHYRIRARAQASATPRRKRLEELTNRLGSLDLRLRIARARRRLEAADTSAVQLIRLRLTRAYGSLNPLSAHLTQLSPLKILERGYAIVTNETGGIVKRPADARAESIVGIRLAQGKVAARVLAERELESAAEPDTIGETSRDAG